MSVYMNTPTLLLTLATLFSATQHAYISHTTNSHERSIGVYRTGHLYHERDGYSMHLYRLDPGLNNNAFKHHSVMHPARYVGMYQKTLQSLIALSGIPTIVLG